MPLSLPSRRLFSIPPQVYTKWTAIRSRVWPRFKNLAPSELYRVIEVEVFPFAKTLGGEETAFGRHMKDARFTLPPEKAGQQARLVDMLDQIPLEDRDTKGDLYEYMLSKLSSAGQNGQFRTPRHIIKMMVALVAPVPTDILCDPACGTAGFMIASDDYLREHHPEIFSAAVLRRHYETAVS